MLQKIKNDKKGETLPEKKISKENKKNKIISKKKFNHKYIN